MVSRECSISGSPHVDSYRLNDKFDLHVSVCFSWLEANPATQAAPRIVVTSTLLVRGQAPAAPQPATSFPRAFVSGSLPALSGKRRVIGDHYCRRLPQLGGSRGLVRSASRLNWCGVTSALLVRGTNLHRPRLSQLHSCPGARSNVMWPPPPVEGLMLLSQQLRGGRHRMSVVAAAQRCQVSNVGCRSSVEVAGIERRAAVSARHPQRSEPIVTLDVHAPPDQLALVLL